MQQPQGPMVEPNQHHHGSKRSIPRMQAHLPGVAEARPLPFIRCAQAWGMTRLGLGRTSSQPPCHPSPMRCSGVRHGQRGACRWDGLLA